ncbi:MAG: hypothetical protein V2J10_11720 [Wenzhouxiangella sp.]|jgi:hypothetical protein|nr:hypothetical protein [Wenzhouxiangella sp.]
MKRLSLFLSILISAFLLSACAGSAQVRQSATRIDGVYVDTVERHATRAGVEVVWVNPPTRRVRAESNQ